MARPRSELHEILKEITPHVYFQPPSTVKMIYPCIVYERQRADSKFGDNGLYRYTKNYQVTVIDVDPDSEIPDKVAHLPMTLHSNFFAVDDLNHDVFNLYF